MKIHTYMICLGFFFLISCSKELMVSNDPEFNVTVESASYQAGEEVLFKMTGGADMISFYSGEIGSDYTFRGGRVVELEDPGARLAFTSGVTGGAQANQLSVLVSSDFNGNFESLASVQAANWTDITSRFKYGTSATFVASGTVDVSDLIVPGAPFYIAFKYQTKPQATNGLARNWMIQGITLTSKTRLNGADVLITNQAGAGFGLVDEDPENAPARSQITATRVSLLGNLYKDPANPIFDPDNPIFNPKNPIYVRGNPQYDPNAVRPEFVPYDPESPYNDPQREHWAVSKALYTAKVDLGPDLSVPIRGLSTEVLEEYRYTYSQPGTYKAYFVASNNTVHNEKTVIKEVTVKIIP